MLFKEVNTCYFNPAETNHTELVESHHYQEVQEEKGISEEPRKSPNTGTGKGILRKQLPSSLLLFKLLDDLALPLEFLFLVSNMDNPYFSWTISSSSPQSLAIGQI